MRGVCGSLRYVRAPMLWDRMYIVFKQLNGLFHNFGHDSGHRKGATSGMDKRDGHSVSILVADCACRLSWCIPGCIKSYDSHMLCEQAVGEMGQGEFTRPSPPPPDRPLASSSPAKGRSHTGSIVSCSGGELTYLYEMWKAGLNPTRR